MKNEIKIEKYTPLMTCYTANEGITFAQPHDNAQFTTPMKVAGLCIAILIECNKHLKGDAKLTFDREFIRILQVMVDSQNEYVLQATL